MQFTSSYPRNSEDISGNFIYILNVFLSKYLDIIVLAPDSFKTKKFEIINKIKIYRFQYFIKKYQKLVYGDSILQNLNRNIFLYFQVPFFMISEIINFLKVVNKEKIDIVHAHWIFPQGFLAAVLRKIFILKFNLVVTSHGGDIYGLKNKFLRKIIKWTLNNSDLINPVSTPIKNEIIQMNINGSVPIRVLSMGVDSKNFYKKKNDYIKNKYKAKKFILFVGRLSAKKGVEFLIEAMPLILNNFPEMILIIVGEGHEEYYLKKLTNELNLIDNIIFTGNIPNNELLRYYSEAEIFIGPSIIVEYGDTEGLGLTFVEAMFCGCPVIGTRVGGISDIIIHEKTGLLVEQKNPEQIANAVTRLLEDENLRKRLIKNGMKHVKEKYSWEKIAKKYHRIYKDIL